MRLRPPIPVTAVVLLLAAVPAAAQRPCATADSLGPSGDLYCMELVAAPGVDGVSGRVELALPPGPFTVAVTAAGRPRVQPVMSLAGLPAPASFGRFHHYVAWASTPAMHPTINLGEVRNGRTTLPVIALEKFVLLVTAEEHVSVGEPGGRVLLRAQSPSTRLFPPDLQEFMLGSAPSGGMTDHGMPDSAPANRGMAGPGMVHHGMADHEAAADSEPARWTTVPMPAGLTMLPGEMALRPDLSPYLPSGDAPAARPRQTVRLLDGDTLRLEAGLARRTILGRHYTMFAFNGQYPGPLIETRRGTEATIVFSNHLPESTSVHWHGIRLDNASDGTPGLTQPAVAPGETFTYRLRFPDAGIYWYHPHVREDVQQELGLYGNILVRSPADDSGAVNREEVLMLDDLLTGKGGLVPLGGDAPSHALMGRFGNTMLVNGEPGYRLSVRRGEVVRFWLTNAANTRVFNLSFAGARMKLVGSDVGRYGREAWVSSVVIGPAERYVVDVRFDRPGRVALVSRVLGIDHLFGRFFPERDTLGVVEVASSPVRHDLGRRFVSLRGDSTAAAEMARYLAAAASAPVKSLVLTIEAHDLPRVTRRLMQLDSIFFAPVEWSGTMPMMNWASTGKQIRWIVRDPETGRENMDIDWRFRRGEPVRIRLVNERRNFHAMQHPIHLHGQRFLVLSVNGVPNGHPVWKDTVLVPAGSVVEILLDPSNPGRWMLHCHIAEHLSTGMMMPFTVE